LGGTAQVLTDMIVLRKSITLNSMLIVRATSGPKKPYKRPDLGGRSSLVDLCRLE
jgi:hypothetical protein